MHNLHDHKDDPIVAHAIAQLASIFGSGVDAAGPIDEDTHDALWLACNHLGKAMGIAMVKPTVASASSTAYAALMAIAKTSQFRIRKVALKGRWWEYDNGPLLAFDGENYQPLALIMTPSGHYQRLDATGIAQPLTPEDAQTLAPDGYVFYRSLPAEPLALFGLLTFALGQQKRDIFRLSFLQAGIGLLALLTPIGTGILLEHAVPDANISLLQQWLIGLLAGLVGISAFGVVRELLLIRLRFKTNAVTQAAVWDRLLRLPLDFFQRFSPGDLTMRASAVDNIQQELTGITLQAVLSSIFSLFTLTLMFYYSRPLAMGALGLLIIMLGSIWLFAWFQLRYQRPITQLQGQLASLTLQFLNGISKLRVSHNEKRAFALWVDPFAHKNRLFLLSAMWGIRFTILQGLLATLGLVGLYAVVGMQTHKLSFGSFIAFNAAFGQFFAAMLALGSVMTTLMQLIPLYERIQPILTAVPERETEGDDPGIVSGQINLQSVSFRYDIESAWVLEDLSLSIAAGEMVAFVGRTGCGKSTLFRLLLGFAHPTSGHILYDEHRLEQLNLRALREQFGVVLQNGTLLPATIFETIAGPHPLTLENAWEAAKQVNLDTDIAAMPMGMHTLLAEAGKTLSTGQRQRLMIARALATKPRLLFLDEATSALDNPTQREVMANLANLNMTRIVAAHRLSTVVDADKIYVLEEGRIVQSGTYKELIAIPGLFAHLVQRQLI